MKIGEILIGSGMITSQQLEEALNYASYKQIPVGRALRVLRFLAEDNLSRVVEAQRGIKKGLDAKLALDLLRQAKDSNRTFNYILENSPVAQQTVPTALIEAILDKKVDPNRQAAVPISKLAPGATSGPIQRTAMGSGRMTERQSTAGHTLVDPHSIIKPAPGGPSFTSSQQYTKPSVGGPAAPGNAAGNAPQPPASRPQGITAAQAAAASRQTGVHQIPARQPAPPQQQAQQPPRTTIPQPSSYMPDRGAPVPVPQAPKDGKSSPIDRGDPIPVAQPKRDAQGNLVDRGEPVPVQPGSQPLQLPGPPGTAAPAQQPPPPPPPLAVPSMQPLLPVQASATVSVRFDQLMEIGDKAFQSNELETAEKAYIEARGMGENLFHAKPSKHAAVLVKLANLYLATDRYAQAQPLYERVLELQQKIFGMGSVQVTRALEDLSELNDIQNKIAEAQRYINDAFKSYYNQGTFDLEVGGRLLRRLHSITKRLEEQPACPRIGELAVDANILTPAQLQQALQTSKQTGAPIGSVLRSSQLLNSQQIESLLFAQLLIKQNTVSSVVAVNAVRLAAANRIGLRQLCENLKFIDRDQKDEHYNRLVLEQENLLTAEARLGPTHLEVARIGQRVADIHLARHDWLSAELLLKRAMSIMDKNPGIDKSVSTKICESLAQAYLKNSKYAEAQPLLFRVLEYLQTNGQGETAPAADALWHLGKIELSQQNFPSSLSFLRTSRAIFEKLAPGSTPLELLSDMLTCAQELPAVPELEPILLQMIDVAHQKSTVFESTTANYIERLGDFYMAAGRNDDALVQFQFALQIRKTNGPQVSADALSVKVDQAMKGRV